MSLVTVTDAHVIVCDDSALVRSIFTSILEQEPGITVVARVGDGQLAVAEVARQRACGRPVDVVVLDIEMPVMDGLTALPLLLRADPSVRVLIASNISARGAQIALRALSLGASDYLAKPSTSGVSSDGQFRAELLSKVRGLTRLRRPPAAGPGLPPDRLASRLQPKLLAISSSTGGPNALFTLLRDLGHIAIPTVLTQHMPATFMPILAEHITRLGFMPCAEATDGEPLLPGRIYLAPGERHLLVSATDGRLAAHLSSAGTENHCRPSVDLMMRSVAASCPGQAIALVLTGMGRDGLEGARCIVDGGGTLLAQNEATSVVWGMPGAVARAGLCHAVLPLQDLGCKIRGLVKA